MPFFCMCGWMCRHVWMHLRASFVRWIFTSCRPKNNVDLSYVPLYTVIVVYCFIVSLWALQTPGGLVWKRTKLLFLERSIAATIAMDTKNRKHCASQQRNLVSSESDMGAIFAKCKIIKRLYRFSYILKTENIFSIFEIYNYIVIIFVLILGE